MMSLQILTFLECLLVSFLEICVLFVYYYYTDQYNRIFISLVYLFFQTSFSYSVTRKFKEDLLFYCLSNQSKRYQSIFQSMKSCFINFYDKKIKFINKSFQEILLKNKAVNKKRRQSESKSNSKNLRNLLKLYEYTKENTDKNKSINDFIQYYSGKF